MRMWQAKWSWICQLRNLSGASWDDNEKTIIMGDDETCTYIEAHHWTEGLLNKPIGYYDDLTIICSNDIATCELATDDVGVGPNNADLSPSEVTGTRRGLSSSYVGSDGMSISSKSIGKYAASPSKGAHIEIFTSVLSRVAGVMKHIQEGPKLAKSLNEALDELVGEMSALTTFNADFIMWANDILVEKPNLAYSFLDKTVEGRKKWLHRQYHDVATDYLFHSLVASCPTVSPLL